MKEMLKYITFVDANSNLLPKSCTVKDRFLKIDDLKKPKIWLGILKVDNECFMQSF